jgi:anti-sigma regulatory factor (Ser/Thr protein kinase)
VTGLDLALPAVPDSVPRARAALTALSDVLLPERLDDLRLLVSELVTNSVRHAGLDGGDAIDLRVELLADRIRVEIHDPGPGFEPPAVPTTMYQDSGWGLYLVSRIADRWGIDATTVGKTVWLELAR